MMVHFPSFRPKCLKSSKKCKNSKLHWYFFFGGGAEKEKQWSFQCFFGLFGSDVDVLANDLGYTESELPQCSWWWCMVEVHGGMEYRGFFLRVKSCHRNERFEPEKFETID